MAVMNTVAPRLRRDRDGNEYWITEDNDGLRMTGYPGTSGVHVVSFTGIGFQMGGIQTEEFRRSLQDRQREHAATYVIDKTKSWFNRTGQAILPLLHRETMAARRVVTLGNSMGGFGAAYFAALLPRCDRAIAFVPQFSVNPAWIPPREYRWAALREAIGDHRIGHALETLAPRRRYIVFCGAASGLDREHAIRFKEHGGSAVDVILVSPGRHDLAAQLKEAGCLHALLDLVIEQDELTAEHILALLEAHGMQASAM